MIPERPGRSPTVAWSEADPVRVVILEALIIPEVNPSRVIRADALIDVSVIVTASFPKPVIVPAALDVYAVLISAAVPVIVVA